jgi:hypothetical protein
MQSCRRTRAFFSSQFANSNYQGRFFFSWREPIIDIISLKIKKVVIANFTGITSSPYYFLRSDCQGLTRATATFCGAPSLAVALIPNNPHNVGNPIDIAEEDDSEAYNLMPTLQNLWFEVLDYNGAVINPTDTGWAFAVELQIVVKLQ